MLHVLDLETRMILLELDQARALARSLRRSCDAADRAEP
jgi:hypothetical protein